MMRRYIGSRRGTPRVAINDRRPPMLRLLQDGQLKPEADGRVMVAVNYDQQWRTLFRAQELGYLDEDQFLTDKGRRYLDRKTVKALAA